MKADKEKDSTLRELIEECVVFLFALYLLAALEAFIDILRRFVFALVIYWIIVFGIITFVLYRFIWPLETESWIKWTISIALYLTFGVVTPAFVVLTSEGNDGRNKNS